VDFPIVFCFSATDGTGTRSLDRDVSYIECSGAEIKVAFDGTSEMELTGGYFIVLEVSADRSPLSWTPASPFFVEELAVVTHHWLRRLECHL
jgi:hypothetical protein